MGVNCALFASLDAAPGNVLLMSFEAETTASLQRYESAISVLFAGAGTPVPYIRAIDVVSLSGCDVDQ